MKWDQQQRLRLIELVTFWEGRLTTNHLMLSFGIGRQQASRDINYYIKEIAPENLVYDMSLRGYVPTPQFSPKFISGHAQEFLNLLANQEVNSNMFAPMEFAGGLACSLPLPARKVNAEHIRKILQSAFTQSRLKIEYRSMAQPKPETRVIIPHTIICTPLRWHVRAFCENNQAYRDFVLSRFDGNLEIMGESEHSRDQDVQWNTFVNIELAPNPRLSLEQREMLIYEYSMDGGTITVKCRSALILYTLRSLNIVLDEESNPVSIQQLIVVNHDEVRRVLLNSMEC